MSNSFTINIVTKTKSIVESQQSFNEDFTFDWNTYSENAKYFHVGQTSPNTKAKFSGYMNAFVVATEPQSIEELLNNYNRISIELSLSYEATLILSVFIMPTTDYVTIVDSSYVNTNITVTAAPESVQIKEFSSNTLNMMCKFYHIRNCFSVNTRDMPRTFTTKLSVIKNMNIGEDHSFNFEIDDNIYTFQDSQVFTSGEILALCERVSKPNIAFTGTYDGTSFVPDFIINREVSSQIVDYTEPFYYNRSAHGDLIYLGRIPSMMAVPSIYPNHGQSKRGDTVLVDIDLIYNKYSVMEIGDVFTITYYDEFISFSLDCDDVQGGDVKIQRQSDGTFEQLNTSLFSAAGHYLMCWKPPFIDYEGYLNTYQSYWDVTEVPTASSLTASSIGEYNTPFRLALEGTLALYDEFQIFIEGGSDCDPAFRIFDSELNKIMYFTGIMSFNIWPPDTNLEMHLCWRTKSNGLYTTFERVNYSNGTDMIIDLGSLYTYPNPNPRFFDFSHQANSIIRPNETFWFSFANSTDGYPGVIPSQNPINASDYGKFIVISSHGQENIVNETRLTHINNEPNQGSLSCHKEGEQEGK